MSNTIDTLRALTITLDGIVSGNFGLDKSGYDYSDILEQLTDGENDLIAYLENEYHQHHGRGLLINDLTQSLKAAADLINAAMKDETKEVYHEWRAVAALCKQWINTIDRYYNQEPEGSTTDGELIKQTIQWIRTRQKESLKDMHLRAVTEQRMVPIPVEKKREQPRPKKQSKAAARLQSQELQEVKSKLIAAGIIVDGDWQCSPAEFGCLVNELRDERGINDHGRRAWKLCANWVGYHGNIESARSAIEKHIDTEGPTADLIRDICKPK